jgi:hypothetical protein
MVNYSKTVKTSVKVYAVVLYFNIMLHLLTLTFDNAIFNATLLVRFYSRCHNIHLQGTVTREENYILKR